MLDVRQKYKYGVGQNGWIHDMAKEKGVDDYELSKDGIKLLSKGEPFIVPSRKIAAYQKTQKEDDLPLHRVIKKALDEFFDKIKLDIPMGTNLKIFYDKMPHKLFVYGIQSGVISDMVNSSINQNKELLDLFSQLSMVNFSKKI